MDFLQLDFHVNCKYKLDGYDKSLGLILCPKLNGSIEILSPEDSDLEEYLSKEDLNTFRIKSNYDKCGSLERDLIYISQK